MGLGQGFRQLKVKVEPFLIEVGLDLDLHRDLVCEVVFAPDIYLELINCLVLAHYRLNSAWVDVGAAYQLHVVPSAPDTAVINVPGTTAGAGVSGHFHNHVLGAVAYHWDEASAKRGNHPLPQLTVAYRLFGVWVDYFFYIVVLYNVGPAWLV